MRNGIVGRTSDAEMRVSQTGEKDGVADWKRGGTINEGCKECTCGRVWLIEVVELSGRVAF